MNTEDISWFVCPSTCLYKIILQKIKSNKGIWDTSCEYFTGWKIEIFYEPF